MSTDREVRTLPVADAGLELRTEEGRNLPTIYGYTAVFNVLSHDLGGFRERIQPSAFQRTLSEGHGPVKAFHNHNADIVLGNTAAGTLELHTDDHGLAHRISPPDNEWGRPVVDAIERGDVDGMSFTFKPAGAKGAAFSRSDSGPIRDLFEVRLFEVSTVSGFAAYPQATVGVRALARHLGVKEDDLLELLNTDSKELDQRGLELLEQMNERLAAVEASVSAQNDAMAVQQLLQRRAAKAAELGLPLPTPPEPAARTPEGAPPAPATTENTNQSPGNGEQ